MSGNYIYHIVVKNNQHYIGKYSKKSTKTIYQYHLERAAPLFLGYSLSKSVTNKSDAWELNWRNNIKSVGLNRSKYLTSIFYTTEDKVNQYFNEKLMATIGKHSKINNPSQMWKFFDINWNIEEYRRAEALTIMAIKKKNWKILNTQIDFMGQTAFLTKDWFSKDEYERKLKTYFHTVPEIWVSISAEKLQGLKLKPHFIQENQLKENELNKRDLLKYPQVADIVYNKIFQKTLNEIKPKVQEEFDKVKKFYNKDQQQKMDSAINQIFAKYKKVSTVFKHLQDFTNTMKSWNVDLKEMSKNLQIASDNIAFDTFQQQMEKFLKKINFNDIKFNNQLQIDHENYKKHFTKAMQDVIKGNNTHMKNSKNIQKESIVYVNRIANWRNNNWDHPDYGGNNNFISQNVDNIWNEQYQIFKGRNIDIKYY